MVAAGDQDRAPAPRRRPRRYWIATSLPRRGSGAPRARTRPQRRTASPVLQRTRARRGGRRRRAPAAPAARPARAARAASSPAEGDRDPARGAGRQREPEAAVRRRSAPSRRAARRERPARGPRDDPQRATGEAGAVGVEQAAAESARRRRRARSARCRGARASAAGRRSASSPRDAAAGLSPAPPRAAGPAAAALAQRHLGAVGAPRGRGGVAGAVDRVGPEDVGARAERSPGSARPAAPCRRRSPAASLAGSSVQCSASSRR